ncbi:MAG TPA: nodulation protein NodZ [Rhizomicrobium sp.]|nr:nodulation protein NodZ [Rhizomicrobium sp.]
MSDDRAALSAPAKILWVKAKAGMGNRLLALSTAHVYAQLSRRALYVDWSDATYSSDGKNVFQSLFFSDDILNEAPKVDESTTVVPAIWKNRLGMSVNHLIDLFDPDKHSAKNIWRKHSINLRRTDYSEQIAVYWSFSSHLREMSAGMKENPRYGGKSEKQIIADIYTNRIKLHPAIQEKVEKFAADHTLREAIGLHIRYMDKKASIRDFLPRLDKIVRENPGARIFLATDNLEAERIIRKDYPRVITTPKWYPETGSSMHQNPECPDKLQNAIEALTDMYLLARCRWLIFPGRSTFSLISSLISDAPSENIYDVDRWQLKSVLRSTGNFVADAVGAAFHR